MKVPELDNKELKQFLTDLLKLADDREASFLSRIQANDSILVLSPSKKTYKIHVDDAGAVIATLVQG